MDATGGEGKEGDEEGLEDEGNVGTQHFWEMFAKSTPRERLTSDIFRECLLLKGNNYLSSIFSTCFLTSTNRISFRIK